jgi:maestro heat-like repeat-containing protein family member 1
MKSMNKIFEVADDEVVSSLLINICVRLKPSFEKKSKELRSASILLFGSIAKYTNGSVGESLLQNINSYLPIIILHLLDDEKIVVESCKKSLRKLIPTLGSKKLSDLFNSEIFDENSTLDFDSFSNAFSVLWISEFPKLIGDLVSKLVTFFKSDWVNIIYGACMITGYLIAKCDSDQRQRINLRQSCSALIGLLKNNNVIVRNKASKILGLLYDA